MKTARLSKLRSSTTKWGGTASGNLIVILLDINGQPLEKQQSCTKQDGLLELSNERSATQSFTFM